MKILLTNTGPWGSGSFSFVEALHKDLTALGHEVRLFFPDTGTPPTSHPDYRIWRFPITDGTTTIESFPCFLPEIHPRSTTKETFRSLSEKQLALYFAKLKKELAPLLEEFQPDIVECQHIWSIQEAVHALGYPYLCTAHHSDQLGFAYDERMRPTLLTGAKNAEAIITLTERDRAEVSTLYNISPNKITPIPFGFDPTFLHFEKKPKELVYRDWNLPIPKEARVVTFVGHLTKLKGADLLIEAIQRLNLSDVHFVLVGKGDLSTLFSKDELAALDLSRVHCTGFMPHEKLPEILTLSTLFALPSREEGFGIVCLEAMSCGLPVVYPTETGVEEYAVGHAFTNGSVEALTEALRTLLTETDLTSLGAKARKAAQQLSREELAKKRIALYQNCIRKSPRKRPAV